MHARKTAQGRTSLSTRGALRLTACLMTAATLSGCGGSTQEIKTVTVKPACAALKPVCPVRDDLMQDATAKVALRNNEALKAMCGAKWAECPKRPPPVMGPPAPMPHPSSTPQVEAKTS